MKKFLKEEGYFWLLLLIICIGIHFLLSSCKTKEYVKIPEYHTEYLVRTDTVSKLDSVYLKDSVFVMQKGDTIFYNKVLYRDRTHNIYKVKLDTIIKRDSINVPYPAERQLTKNEQRLMTLGRCYIGTFFLLIVCAVGFTFWYHNKKC